MHGLERVSVPYAWPSFVASAEVAGALQGGVRRWENA
jgi:hypothetical protein